MQESSSACTPLYPCPYALPGRRAGTERYPAARQAPCPCIPVCLSIERYRSCELIMGERALLRVLPSPTPLCLSYLSSTGVLWPVLISPSLSLPTVPPACSCMRYSSSVGGGGRSGTMSVVKAPVLVAAFMAL